MIIIEVAVKTHLSMTTTERNGDSLINLGTLEYTKVKLTVMIYSQFIKLPYVSFFTD